MTSVCRPTERIKYGDRVEVIAPVCHLAVFDCGDGDDRAGLTDLPEHISGSQQYRRDFTRIAKEQNTVEDLVSGMMELHGDRDNPHTLWISARAAMANRT